MYEKCEDIPDQTTCQNSNPLTNSNVIDQLNKCVWENTCKKQLRLCSDYKNRDSDYPGLCSSLSTQNNLYKICLLDSNNDTCQEIYSSCDSYNNVVTDKDKRKVEECTAIQPGNTGMNYENGLKCVLDSETKECKEVYKECKDFTDEDLCNIYSPEDTDKQCIFKNNECVEDYKYCETYSSQVLEKDRKAEDCASIIPIYYDGFKYKCVYDESKKSCNKQKIETCEDYEGNDEDFCTSITLTDYSLYKCILQNNKCCEAYNTQTKKDKETCESIILSKDYKKCVFDSEKNSCNEEYKTCSEYTGTIAENCGAYKPSVDDDTKVCIFENNKCVEKTNYVFTSCSDYLGEDASICEAIQPFKSSKTYEIDYGYKCTYDKSNKQCNKVKKQCSEAMDEYECYKITPSNNDKYCIYKGNACQEEYISCQAYQKTGNTLNEEICNSIMIKDDIQNKCVFSKGADGARDTCQSTRKTCADFNIDLLAGVCSSLTVGSDDTKKCSLSNKVCSLVDKTTCLELYNSVNANEEICKAATTSSTNLACEYGNSNGIRGCFEVNKRNEQSNTDNNNAKEKYLNKILFALLCLLLY